MADQPAKPAAAPTPTPTPPVTTPAPAPPSDRVTLTIDGKSVNVAKGTLLVEAARQAGIEIPVFCYHSRLTPVGACRMCLVEIEKMPRLQTACTTPVGEGMVVSTQSKQATSAQEGVLELLLANHPLDCPICDKGGECPLQDNTFKHGPGQSRYIEEKRHKDKAFELGPRILLDKERCILCYRCVRFHQEVPGDEALAVIDRGGEGEIGTLDGHGYDSPFSGNTIDLCPVGALTSVDYRFRSRPWDLTRRPSVCSGCSMGCNTEIHARNGTILRLVPRENVGLNDIWLCDRGRFDTKVGREGRLGTPSLRAAQTFGPPTSSMSWSEGIAHVAKLVKGARVGIHVSGDVSNEALGVLTQGLLPQLPNAVVSIDAACATAWPVQGDVTQLDRASAFVLVDFDVWNDLPVLALTLRRGIRRGAKLIVLGDRNGLARDTHHAFPVARAELASTLDGLRNALSGTSADPRLAAASAALQSGTVAVLASTASAADAATRTALGAFVDALGAKTKVVLQGAPSLVANAAGAQRIAGSLIGGVDVLARAREGSLDVLLTLGTLPPTAPTSLACTTVALSWQPPIGSDGAQAAHVILPTCHLYEQGGSLINFAGTVQPLEAGGMPPKGALADHRALAELANALGANLPLELKELRARLAKNEPLFTPLITLPSQRGAGSRQELLPVQP